MSAHIEKVESAISALRQGKMVILTDHPEREDEGDLIFPAEMINAEVVNFMIHHCSGIICLPTTKSRLQKLSIHHMVPPHENGSAYRTPFMVSIEAKEGVSTGVSAQDRARTIAVALDDQATPEDLVKPGHIFPLLAQDGGVLERAGHTEGAVDLVRMAGFKPAAVICEVMNKDGTVSRGEHLRKFSLEQEIPILSIQDLIHYRRTYENLISEEVSTMLPLEGYGEFQMSVFKEKLTGHEHITLQNTNITVQDKGTLVRVHSSCITGDLFHSERCDCNKQLHYSLERISKEGGVLIYLNQEGRGIGLFNKIKAYSLQENGLDTVEANQHLGLPIDSRGYYLAANWLKNKNIQVVRLLTNNPQKIEGLKKYGISNLTQEMMPVFCGPINQNYLRSKKEKLNHIINF